MRNISSLVFKYLAWALLIIVILLYMENYDIRQQAIVLLVGVVAIDAVFSISALVRRGVKQHNKRVNAAKKSRKKKQAKKNESTAVSDAAEAVKEAGTALRDTAEITWNAMKEKGSSVKNAVMEKLNGSSEDSLPAIEDGKKSK